MFAPTVLRGPVAGYFPLSPEELSSTKSRFILYDTCADKSDCQRHFANTEQGALTLESGSSGKEAWSNDDAATTNEPDNQSQLRRLQLRLTHLLHKMHSPFHPHSQNPTMTLAWNSNNYYASASADYRYLSSDSFIESTGFAQFPPTPEVTPKDSFLRSPSLDPSSSEDEGSTGIPCVLFATDDDPTALTSVDTAALHQDDDSANFYDGMMRYLGLSLDCDANPLLTDPFVVERDLHHYGNVNAKSEMVGNTDLTNIVNMTALEGLVDQLLFQEFGGAVSTSVLDINGGLWNNGGAESMLGFQNTPDFVTIIPPQALEALPCLSVQPDGDETESDGGDERDHSRSYSSSPSLYSPELKNEDNYDAVVSDSEYESFSFSPSSIKREPSQPSTAANLGHPNRDKHHQCHECGNLFKHKYNLRLHCKSHIQPDLVRCQYVDPETRRKCDATFTRTYDLTRHLQIHEGRKSFPCQKCGKAFTRRDALQRHLRTKGH